MLCYLLVVSYFLFGWVTTNSESLPRIQLHWPDANHSVFIIFSFEGHMKSGNNDFFKTWDTLYIDAQTQRLTYRKKIKKNRKK